ncbi:hypothetical protein WTH01_15580 [Weissella thailandensis]|nr:hypothetical protein WTH01_15580 [Weissella thailandensis]
MLVVEESESLVFDSDSFEELGFSFEELLGTLDVSLLIGSLDESSLEELSLGKLSLEDELVITELELLGKLDESGSLDSLGRFDSLELGWLVMVELDCELGVDVVV